MLQQTQVSTVIPYYRRWLEKFPDVDALSRARPESVMKAWEGLGYYRRASMLLRAARIVSKRFQGRFPQNREALRALPGVGRYTAGAVASISFDEPVPAVDGNVKRILARLFGINRPPDEIRTVRQMESLAVAMISRRFPGDFNQALMDLGSSVCVPENPRCPKCPARRFCRAHARGWTGRLPLRKKTAEKKIREAALVLRAGGRVLLEKQRKRGRWHGLWAFPWGKTLEEIFSEKGIGRIEGRLIADLKFGYTVHRVTLKVFAAVVPKMQPVPKPLRWVDWRRCDSLPMPAPHQKIRSMVAGSFNALCREESPGSFEEE
jgi:A/G-specific adenine glycosylase